MISMRRIAMLCVAAVPLTATAVPVTYQFSGVLDMGGGSTLPDGVILDPIVPLGTAFSGSFTLEDETPVTFQDTGVLIYDNAITAGSITFGSTGQFGTFSFAPQPYVPGSARSSSLLLMNDREYNGNPPYDQFTLAMAVADVFGDDPNLYRSLSFVSTDATAQKLPSGMTLRDPLPVDALVSGFYQLSFGWQLYGGGFDEPLSQYVGSQHLLLSAVTSVPEPGTLPMMAMGLAGVWWLSRRRRSDAL